MAFVVSVAASVKYINLHIPKQMATPVVPEEVLNS
jgi:hypothetical protein